MSSGSILKDRILQLRRNRKSYREIAHILGITKSTVSYWIANNPESQAIKKILNLRNIARSRKRIRKIIATSRKKWEIWRAAARKEAAQQFPALFHDPIFIAGIAIYWGEGDSKVKNPLRIANTDPRMIRTYVYFLTNVLNIASEKIRIGLILYPDLDAPSNQKFWGKVTGLMKSNFIKPQYIRGYHPTKRLEHGICVVTVNSRQWKEKMLKWIDLFSKSHKMNGNLRV